jgi:hypothetical protein
LTGQINEEKMSVYVRLGIRLLYKGLKSKEMEGKRSEFVAIQLFPEELLTFSQSAKCSRV